MTDTPGPEIRRLKGMALAGVAITLAVALCVAGCLGGLWWWLK